MSIVIDSSVTLAIAMEDEELPNEEAFLERISREGALVPTIWAYEVSNSILVAVRRGRISGGQGDTRLSLVMALPMTIDDQSTAAATHATFDIASTYGLTVYDAAYLELAIRHDAPLATLDKALARAARTAQIEVIGIDA